MVARGLSPSARAEVEAVESRKREETMVKRGSLALAVAAAAALVYWVAVASATPPGTAVSWTDTTNPATLVTTALGTIDDGAYVKVLTKRTIDGAFNGAMTGPFHTTILTVQFQEKATGTVVRTDTTGVDYCACVDPNGNSGEVANHLIGVTGSATHTVFGAGNAGLSDDRGTFTLVRVGATLTDQGFLVTSPPCLTGRHAGPMTAGAGDSLCLGPGAVVTGPIRVSDGGELFARGATITGPVRVDGASAVGLCGNRITGPLSISGGVVPELVGEPASGDCDGNRITGPVSLAGNTTGLDFSGNTVTGPVRATDNTGGFVFGEFAPNAVSGPVTTSGNV
jgi:hypothetical protein